MSEHPDNMVPQIFVVTWRKANRIGSYALEGEELESREAIVSGVVGWEWSDLDRIFCGTREGIHSYFSDVTEEIAESVLAYHRRHTDYRINSEQIAWLESVLGVGRVGRALGHLEFV